MEILHDSENHAKRLFQRSKQDVLKKILKVYKLSEREVFPPSQLLSAKINEIACSHEWNERVGECTGFSGIELDEAQRRGLNNAACRIMHNYSNAFLLRKKIKEIVTEADEALQKNPSAVSAAQKSIYHDVEGREYLIDIYVNHITNEALEMLKAFQFDERSALSLNKFLIKNLVMQCRSKEIGLEKAAYVSPGARKALSSQTASTQLAIIKEYWKNGRDYLNMYYRRTKSDHGKS